MNNIASSSSSFTEQIEEEIKNRKSGEKRSTSDPSGTIDNSPDGSKEVKRRKSSDTAANSQTSEVLEDHSIVKREHSSTPSEDIPRSDISGKPGGIEILGKCYNCVNEFKDWSDKNDSTGDRVNENEPRIKLKSCLTSQQLTDRHCNWRGCKRRTRKECSNLGCEKLACETIHSYLICLECTKSHFDRFHVTAKPASISQVQCKILQNCKNRTKRVCSLSLCSKPVCDQHRYKLCQDCCFNSEYNFQVYD